MKFFESIILVTALALAILAAFDANAAIPADAIRTTDKDTICNTKTDTVRNVSEATKHEVYIRDGVPGGNHTGICDGPGGCEADHMASLELGGSNDPSNLMIQPYFGPCNAHQKDHLENKLHRMICTNEIAVIDAQELIYNDWETGYKRFVDPAGCR